MKVFKRCWFKLLVDLELLLVYLNLEKKSLGWFTWFFPRGVDLVCLEISILEKSNQFFQFLFFVKFWNQVKAGVVFFWGLGFLWLVLSFQGTKMSLSSFMIFYWSNRLMWRNWEGVIPLPIQIPNFLRSVELGRFFTRLDPYTGIHKHVLSSRFNHRRVTKPKIASLTENSMQESMSLCLHKSKLTCHRDTR